MRGPGPFVLVAALSLLAGGCASTGPAVDAASDAPEARRAPPPGYAPPASYDAALAAWRTPEDVNAWIGARFEYDFPRALALSESQRGSGAPPAIHSPEAFYEAPSGICVDLSRFAVETLRRIDPSLQARYLMIEFEPATVSGQVLRRHWVATVVRDGKVFVLADSKRPGVMAGPFDSAAAFVESYAAYRGRAVVAFRELESFRRQRRAMAAKRGASAAVPASPSSPTPESAR